MGDRSNNKLSLGGQLGIFGALCTVGFWLSGHIRDQLADLVFEKIKTWPMVGPVVTVVTAFVVANVAVVLFLGASLVIAYWLGFRERKKSPIFVLDKITVDRSGRDPVFYMTVRNTGAPFDNHIAKLLSFRRVRDGAFTMDEGRMPVTLKTSARRGDESSSRFNMSKNEFKQVALCHRHPMHGVIVLEWEGNNSIIVFEEELDGFVAQVGLFAETHSEYSVLVRRVGTAIDVALLTDDEVRCLHKRWSLPPVLNQTAVRSLEASRPSQPR